MQTAGFGRCLLLLLAVPLSPVETRNALPIFCSPSLELYGLDKDLLVRALKVLEAQGKVRYEGGDLAAGGLHIGVAWRRLALCAPELCASSWCRSGVRSASLSKHEHTHVPFPRACCNGPRPSSRVGAVRAAIGCGRACARACRIFKGATPEEQGVKFL